MPTFTLSDETLNSYGFYVKTDGVDLTQFRKNPVMLYDHERFGLMPIGKWNNIRVEDNKILADAEFDEQDEMGKQIKHKVEQGYIRGASSGIRIKVTSEQNGDIKTGQKRPTVMESELVEASITPIPANKNALKLKHNGKTVSLSGDGNTDIESILPYKTNNMKQIATALGLSENADENQIKQAVDQLNADKKELRTQRNNVLLKLGESSGTITDDNRDRMQKLADTDFDLALSFVDKKPDNNQKGNTGNGNTGQGDPANDDGIRLSDVVNALKGNGGDTTKEDNTDTFEWYQKNDPQALLKMKRDNPEKFQKLFDEHYKTTEQ